MAPEKGKSDEAESILRRWSSVPALFIRVFNREDDLGSDRLVWTAKKTAEK